MKYTKDKPTKAGWYWMRNGCTMEVVSVFKWGHHLEVGITQSEETVPVGAYSEDTEWCGPLPTPESEAAE